MVVKALSALLLLFDDPLPTVEKEMPLTKQYLTYKAECRFGVIAGRKGGALLKRGEGGRLIAVSPALEGVVLWDLRTSAMVSLATWLGTRPLSKPPFLSGKPCPTA